jgi:hypothetical protein
MDKNVFHVNLISILIVNNARLVDKIRYLIQIYTNVNHLVERSKPIQSKHQT